MATAEDVLYLYERNSHIYHDCKFKKCLESCETNWNNECYCYTRQTVFPSIIGDQTLPCNLKIKCYIRPGEECPICLEPIFTVKKAHLTECGHAFHKSCILNIMKTKWLSKNYMATVRCPICRCSLGRHNITHRYRSSYNSYHSNESHVNGLDKLEDYLLTHDLILPSFCSNHYDHYLGVKKDCSVCDEYRKYGDL